MSCSKLMDLSSLPFELLLQIFQYLDNDAILNLLPTCHAFYALLSHTLWSDLVIDVQGFYTKSLGYPPAIPLPDPTWQHRDHLRLAQPSMVPPTSSRLVVTHDRFHDLCRQLITRKPHRDGVQCTKTLTVILPMYRDTDRNMFDCKTADDVLRTKHNPHILVYWFLTKFVPAKLINLESIHVLVGLPPCTKKRSIQVKNNAVEVMMSRLPISVRRIVTMHANVGLDARTEISPKVNHHAYLKYLQLSCQCLTRQRVHQTLNDLCGRAALPAELERLDISGSAMETIDPEFMRSGLQNCHNLRVLSITNMVVCPDGDDEPWIPLTVKTLVLNHAGAVNLYESPHVTTLAVDSCSNGCDNQSLKSVFPSLNTLHLNWYYKCAQDARGVDNVYIANFTGSLSNLIINLAEMEIDRLSVVVQNEVNSSQDVNISQLNTKFKALQVVDKFAVTPLAWTELAAATHKLIVNLPDNITADSRLIPVAPNHELQSCYYAILPPNRQLYYYQSKK